MIWIDLDKTSKITLTKQIFEEFRAKILAGELKGGEKLPSTRRLAAELAVSRNTVLEVYDQLLAEGYLTSSEGSGTYVADGATLSRFSHEYMYEEDVEHRVEEEVRDTGISFTIGVSDLARFPRIQWGKCLKEAALDVAEGELDYPDIQGYRGLRQVLSKYLLRVKGIRARACEIFILSGSAEAFILLGELFSGVGSKLVVEDPSYYGILNILRGYELALVPVPVDNQGLVTGLLPDKAGPHHVIVTPSHQFPTGAVLPIQRRIEVINFSLDTHSYIVENDYDSEFRFSGPPISSLRLLNQERVIHVGTFSETMYPALRLGYMVVPGPLVERVSKIKKRSSRYTSVLKQHALMSFIGSGNFERHIGRMKKLYSKKQQLLKELLTGHFKDRITISGDSTGLYVVVEIDGVAVDDAFIERCYESEVGVDSVKNHCIKNTSGNNSEVKGADNRFLLGFGHLSNDEIEEGVKRLANIFF